VTIDNDISIEKVFRVTPLSMMIDCLCVNTYSRKIMQNQTLMVNAVRGVDEPKFLSFILLKIVDYRMILI
jgi:hypothetical protein